MNKLGAVGIDFGTTKTMLVYAEPGRGGVVPVTNFPTAIRFLNEKDFSWNDHEYGVNAYKTPNAWKNFKKFMADERAPVQDCCDAPFEQKEAPSPVLLASFIFRHLKERLEKDYGPIDDEIGPVTITIPSERNFLHRQAVIFAANVAGFKEVNILEEPVAAYLMHYLTRLKRSRANKKTRVFVIDFGGGTCDLAVVESNNGQVPIIINSRTIDQAGNDIDDAIVGLWKGNQKFRNQLPPESAGEYDAYLIQELKEAAKIAKHQCNPRPDATPDGVISLLMDPLSSQRSSEGNETIQLANKELIKPPKLTPQDFRKLMKEILEEIDKQIDYLFPDKADIESIDKVVFAGGSCYIRQVLNYIIQKFAHLNREEDFLFNDPESAIALGALEYQRERNEQRNPIHTRLSMSTYLQVDYESNEISPLVKWLNGTKFIDHNGKSYIELAPKGEPLEVEHPNVSSSILAFTSGSKVITVPFKKSNSSIVWKIFQVRSTEHNNRDYEAITDKTRAIDEIVISPNLLENAINNFNPLRLIYAFDIYGDFYRNARLFTRTASSFQNMHEKNPNLDWRNREMVKQTRIKFFGDKNGRSR